MRGASQAQGPSGLLTTPYLSLLTDPFEAPLDGAGRPDFNSRPVVIWKEEDVRTVTTNAQGEFWITIAPALANVFRTFTLDAGGVITASSGSQFTNNTDLVSTFSEYRPMAIAAHMSYVGQADAAKGVLWGALGIIPTTGDTAAHMLDEPYYTECSCNPLNTVSLKSLEHDNTDFGAVAGTADQDPVTYIHCGGTGLPASSACVRIRFALVFEGVVGHTKLMSRQAQHTPSNMLEVSAGANLVGPLALVSAGVDSYGKLVSTGKRIVDTALKAHGVMKAGLPYLEMLGAALA